MIPYCSSSFFCKIKVLNIFDLINSNVNLLEHTAQSKNITISNTCDTDSTCFADKPTLHTIIRNIMSNALKFTPVNGYIKLSCTKESNYIVVKIEDNGVGIKKDDLTKLFDRKTDRNTIGGKENKGFGLGLLLCDEFIKLNKGFINVESIYGEGSTFFIHIPQS